MFNSNSSNKKPPLKYHIQFFFFLLFLSVLTRCLSVTEIIIFANYNENTPICKRRSAVLLRKRNRESR